MANKKKFCFNVYFFGYVVVLLSFVYVIVNAGSVFSEVKFLNCLNRFFEGLLGTFHRFYKLN